MPKKHKKVGDYSRLYLVTKDENWETGWLEKREGYAIFNKRFDDIDCQYYIGGIYGHDYPYFLCMDEWSNRSDFGNGWILWGNSGLFCVLLPA